MDWRQIAICSNRFAICKIVGDSLDPRHCFILTSDGDKWPPNIKAHFFPASRLRPAKSIGGMYPALGHWNSDYWRCIVSKNDSQLKKDIEDELLWDPRINSAQIGVSVVDGAVSLLGTVDSYAEKWAAEDAAKRVSGVRAITQNLAVHVLPEHVHSDSDIAAAIQNAPQWNVYIPKSVTAQVRQGSVQLEGQVVWNYQRVTAERAVRYLSGVVEVRNLITLKPQSSKAQVNGKLAHFWSQWASCFRTQASARQIREDVLAALRRQAATDAASIHVGTRDTKVTLTGCASSWRSIVDAANAAWAVPGVTHVFDHVKLSR